MERAIIKIHGIVQGVGFRPFIHRLVKDYGLRGFIQNTSSGVTLELEGERAVLERFVGELPRRAPRLALIERVETAYSAQLSHFPDFEIRGSCTEALRKTLISPDAAVCADCRRELFDPRDRRYRYPFINCTNCGPRFTIIRDIPYDRAKTSMQKFPMCPDCEREYHDIENRRYHAQPDCCPVCGPRLRYLDAAGRERAGDAIALAQKTLLGGGVVAVKGLGGMHLACRCDDAAAVRRLRQRKQRDERPFALMCRDLDAARALCELSAAEEAVLDSPQKPIVLLKKREPGLWYLSENGDLGLMLPYTPLHILLMDERFPALVMTSANLSDQPIIKDDADALKKLSGVADGFLLHDREIQTRCDDSLCWVLDGAEYFARRSRGYVPFPLEMARTLPPILACGAEQKASFCLSRGSHVFPSQHIGDLKNMDSYEHYAAQIRHFERLFDVVPALLVHDKHPDYLSTLYAAERGAAEKIPALAVQHHHAHLAACMADNGLDQKLIGLVWDGVGYGEDGTSWGGECLIGDYHGFTRFGSIRPIPLVGGDRAVKELERIAFALLRESGCETGEIPAAEAYEKLLTAKLSCPLSSGMGRLFDGVAAILGLKRRASYEGQGAVLLEAAATEAEGEYSVVLAGAPLRFDWREMIRELVRERDAGIPVGEIAGRFHNTLLRVALALCRAAREQTGLNDVALSGGSFQNMILMRRLPPLLEQAGFRVWKHRRVSCNDEGLSLGQLMIAQAKMEETENDVSGSAFKTD
ncbi:MAG: carbamoyltransferase HypF [Oscillospiraceae bacterium]|nr:carbamoyltransferase HypF [Oscillospiraceae bacterium]